MMLHHSIGKSIGRSRSFVQIPVERPNRLPIGIQDELCISRGRKDRVLSREYESASGFQRLGYPKHQIRKILEVMEGERAERGVVCV